MDLRRAISQFDAREFIRRPETRIGSALLAIMVGVWVFAELAEEVTEEDTTGFDEAIMTAMREGPGYADMAGPEWVSSFARDLTALGGFPFVLLLTLIVIGYLLLSRHFMRAVEVALATGGGAAVVMWLKEVFARPRPEVVPAAYEVATFSFPSGHSSTAAVVYLTLGVLIARFVTRRILTVYTIGVAFALTFIVGWTRVALGVHYPTDVLAGWTMGLTWALFSWLVVHLWETWRGRAERARRDEEMYEDSEAEAPRRPRDADMTPPEPSS